MNVPFSKIKPSESVWFDQKVFTAELIDNCPNSCLDKVAKTISEIKSFLSIKTNILLL